MKEVFSVETPKKGGRDDLLSRVTALFLTVVTLAFSKFVLNDPILDYLNCCRFVHWIRCKNTDKITEGALGNAPYSLSRLCTFLSGWFSGLHITL